MCTSAHGREAEYFEEVCANRELAASATDRSVSEALMMGDFTLIFQLTSLSTCYVSHGMITFL